ncbi:hypothetical protein [Rahnella aquatilis]|uniref:hypothetical protein n=1 Tax=Rahnella aquatilis TaxID=34038 RepID=UPI000647B617|nr:hypothetical protein [Rahnella aquatilis]
MTNLIIPVLNKVPSPVGKGFQLNSSLKEYAFFDTALSAKINGSKSFTIGFWANYPEMLSLEESADVMPIISNSNYRETPDDDPTGYRFESICEQAVTYLQDTLVINQSDEYEATPLIPMQLKADTWTYNAFSIDIENGCLTNFNRDPTGHVLLTNSVPLPPGNIIPPSSHFTAFFNTSDLEFYQPSRTPLQNIIIRFADITVWDRVLTAEEFNAIYFSPAIAGGSEDYIFNSSLQTIENIIQSPDFEDTDSLWWDLSASATIMTDDNEVNHYCNIATSGSISQSVYIENGRSYYLNLQVRGNVEGLLYFRVPGTEKALFSTTLNGSQNSNWHNEGISFTPDTYANRNLELVIELPAGNTSDYLGVDNISLT